MLEAWTAGAAVLRGPLVVAACVGCFVLGAVATAHDTPTPTPATTPVTVAAISDDSVNRLAAALERVTATTPPAEVAPTVTEAEAVIDAVREGDVTVVVTPTTVPPVQATLPPTTTTTTTTSTTTPPTSIANGWEDPPPTTIDPSTTVPPPFTVTVP